jgi:hypothetical protein
MQFPTKKNTNYPEAYVINKLVITTSYKKVAKKIKNKETPNIGALHTLSVSLSVSRLCCYSDTENTVPLMEPEKSSQC